MLPVVNDKFVDNRQKAILFNNNLCLLWNISTNSNGIWNALIEIAIHICIFCTTFKRNPCTHTHTQFIWPQNTLLHGAQIEREWEWKRRIAKVKKKKRNSSHHIAMGFVARRIVWIRLCGRCHLSFYWLLFWNAATLQMTNFFFLWMFSCLHARTLHNVNKIIIINNEFSIEFHSNAKSYYDLESLIKNQTRKKMTAWSLHMTLKAKFYLIPQHRYSCCTAHKCNYYCHAILFCITWYQHVPYMTRFEWIMDWAEMHQIYIDKMASTIPNYLMVSIYSVLTTQSYNYVKYLKKQICHALFTLTLCVPLSKTHEIAWIYFFFLCTNHNVHLWLMISG